MVPVGLALQGDSPGKTSVDLVSGALAGAVAVEEAPSLPELLEQLREMREAHDRLLEEISDRLNE